MKAGCPAPGSSGPIIRRFSEDIDLSLDREGFGYGNDRLNAAPGKKALKSLLDKLRTACETYVNGPLLEGLLKDLVTVLGPNGDSTEDAWNLLPRARQFTVHDARPVHGAPRALRFAVSLDLLPDQNGPDAPARMALAHRVIVCQRAARAPVLGTRTRYRIGAYTWFPYMLIVVDAEPAAWSCGAHLLVSG